MSKWQTATPISIWGSGQSRALEGAAGVIRSSIHIALLALSLFVLMIPWKMDLLLIWVLWNAGARNLARLLDPAL